MSGGVHQKPGRFICIEGADASGKTSVARRLARVLNATYYQTPANPFRRVRKEIDCNADLVTRFHFYLSSVFAASKEIGKLIASGDVVCDRYIESTFVHHEALGLVIPVKEFYYDRILIPDYTIVLEARDRVLAKRIRRRINGHNRSDARLERDRTYQRIVVEKFRLLNAMHIDTTSLRCEEAVDLIMSALTERDRIGGSHVSSR